MVEKFAVLKVQGLNSLLPQPVYDWRDESACLWKRGRHLRNIAHSSGAFCGFISAVLAAAASHGEPPSADLKRSVR